MVGRRKLRIWSVIALIFLVVYCGGYLALRQSRTLVRDATYYTGEGGKRVRTDWIRTGEFRIWGPPDWEMRAKLLAVDALVVVYLPARWAESTYWQRQPAAPAAAQ